MVSTLCLRKGILTVHQNVHVFSGFTINPSHISAEVVKELQRILQDTTSKGLMFSANQNYFIGRKYDSSISMMKDGGVAGQQIETPP